MRSLFTEPYEGKGEADMGFGRWAQKFASTLALANRECASQLFEQMDSTKGANEFIMETAISRSLFKEGSGKALPFLSSCQCVRFNDDGGVTLFEVEGFGEGVTYSEEELRSYDYFGVMTSADGTGSLFCDSSI